MIDDEVMEFGVQMIKNYTAIARQLRYDKDVIREIQRAKSEAEISRIMCTARKRSAAERSTARKRSSTDKRSTARKRSSSSVYTNSSVCYS